MFHDEKCMQRFLSIINMLLVWNNDYFLIHVLCMIKEDRKKPKESHLQNLISILCRFISVTFKFCFHFVLGMCGQQEFFFFSLWGWIVAFWSNFLSKCSLNPRFFSEFCRNVFNETEVRTFRLQRKKCLQIQLSIINTCFQYM